MCLLVSALLHSHRAAQTRRLVAYKMGLGSQDLTGEQKVAMIRKELPLCTAEEAQNALEACAMDVNAAMATLSQVKLCHALKLPVSKLQPWGIDT